MLTETSLYLKNTRFQWLVNYSETLNLLLKELDSEIAFFNSESLVKPNVYTYKPKSPLSSTSVSWRKRHREKLRKRREVYLIYYTETIEALKNFNHEDFINIDNSGFHGNLNNKIFTPTLKNRIYLRLPLEIIEIICQHTFETQDLLNASLVSRDWFGVYVRVLYRKVTLKSKHSLFSFCTFGISSKFTDLSSLRMLDFFAFDLSNCRNTSLISNTIIDLLSRVIDAVRGTIKIIMLGHVDFDILTHILRILSIPLHRLTVYKIHGGEMAITPQLLQITHFTVAHLCSTCHPQLQLSNLSNQLLTTNIKTLILPWANETTSSFTVHPNQAILPHLRSLTIDVSHLLHADLLAHAPTLNALHLIIKSTSQAYTLATVLETLSSHTRKNFRLAIQATQPSTTRITAVDLSGLSQLRPTHVLMCDGGALVISTKLFLVALRSFATSLTHVQLPVRATDDAVEIIVAAAPALSVLVLDGNVSVTKRAVEAIARYACELRYLGVWACRRIGMRALESLLQPRVVPRLRWVKIDTEIVNAIGERVDGAIGDTVGDTVGEKIPSVAAVLVECLKTRFEIVRRETEWMDFELGRAINGSPFEPFL